MRRITLLIAILGLAACGPKKTDLISDVEAFGFNDVQIGSWASFRCSKDDTYGYYFSAINSQGHPVNGVICGGILKGSTVRILHGGR